MASLAEGRSFGCLDLALPEVTCQSIAASSAAVLSSNGQNICRVCEPRVEEEACPCLTSGRE